jgi:hypothetical protein
MNKINKEEFVIIFFLTILFIKSDHYKWVDLGINYNLFHMKIISAILLFAFVAFASADDVPAADDALKVGKKK